MAEIKLTKNELRQQQRRLMQLERYLPTLQLKKALLQAEVNEARQLILVLRAERDQCRAIVDENAALLTTSSSFDLESTMQVDSVKTHNENIAGVEVPIFDSVSFLPLTYDLFDTPAWLDSFVLLVRQLVSAKEKIVVVEKQKNAFEKELRDVSIRVNLFEKILVPRALTNIKKIKVFLGDQQLAAVARAKVAKGKILMRKGVTCV